MRFPAFRRAAVAAFAALSLAACGDSTSNERGTLSVRLMDAPGDVRKAVVTISQVYLQPGEDSGARRVILRDTPFTTDLLTLANDVARLVDSATVPAGRYGQLRFVITGGYLEVEGQNGATQVYASSPTYAGLPAGTQVTGSLQMPSYAQSGLKVQLPNGGVVIGGDEKILLVDFDVARSFGRQAGNSGTWVMTPVVRATDFRTTGTLAATVRMGDGVTMPTVNGNQTSLSQATFTLTAADSTTRTLGVTAGTDGTYRADFRYVTPGTYTVDVKVPGVALATTPTRPTTVTVGSSQAASVAFTVTTAIAAQ